MNKEGKILIVDDVPANVRAIAESLKADYQIFFANDADKAIELAETQSPDLILLDVNMPEMNGFDLAELMRGMGRSAGNPVELVGQHCLIAVKHESNKVGKRYAAITQTFR
jgi:CheY-like chemotaxis protein